VFITIQAMSKSMINSYGNDNVLITIQTMINGYGSANVLITIQTMPKSMINIYGTAMLNLATS
jgi:hypothetical protein